MFSLEGNRSKLNSALGEIYDEVLPSTAEAASRMAASLNAMLDKGRAAKQASKMAKLDSSKNGMKRKLSIHTLQGVGASITRNGLSLKSPTTLKTPPIKKMRSVSNTMIAAQRASMGVHNMKMKKNSFGKTSGMKSAAVMSNANLVKDAYNAITNHSTASLNLAPKTLRNSLSDFNSTTAISKSGSRYGRTSLNTKRSLPSNSSMFDDDHDVFSDPPRNMYAARKASTAALKSDAYQEQLHAKLMKKTAVQLKRELQKLGLPVSGVKKTLAQRIIKYSMSSRTNATYPARSGTSRPERSLGGNHRIQSKSSLDQNSLFAANRPKQTVRHC